MTSYTMFSTCKLLDYVQRSRRSPNILGRQFPRRHGTKECPFKFYRYLKSIVLAAL